MTDERRPLDIEGNQMEGKSGVTGRIIDELRDIQRGQMEGENDVTRSIID